MELESDNNDTLLGISGLGPVRLRLLAEAGFTTRTSLARATVDQMVSITGMPRSAAERILASIADTAPATVVAVAPVAVESTVVEPEVVEAILVAEEVPVLAPVVTLNPDLSPRPVVTRMERAALRAQAAIANASRRAKPDSKLALMLARFATVVDSVPGYLAVKTRPSVLRRTADRINNIADRLEALTKKKSKGSDEQTLSLSPKREKRLRQRLKRTRDNLKRTLKSNGA